jgi:hypothetical protein
MWYKAISEAAKIYLFVCDGKKNYRRATALQEVKEYLPAEFHVTLELLQSYIKDLAAKSPLLTDDLLKLFIWLLSNTNREIGSKVYTKTANIKAVAQIPLEHDTENPPAMIKESILEAIGEFKPYIKRIAIIPRVEFNIDILNNHDIDSFYLVFDLNSLMPAATLRNLLRCVKQNPNFNSVEPFIIIENESALSLYPEVLQLSLKSLNSDPLFFSLVERNGFDSSGNPGNTGTEAIHLCLPTQYLKIFAIRNEKINVMLSGKDIYKFRNLDFCRYFWAAARTKLLVSTPVNSEIYLPLTAEQISAQLVQHYPEKSAWINRFYAEYSRERRGIENELHLFFTEAIAFLYLMR